MGNINQRTYDLFNLHFKKQATQVEIDELFSMLINLNDDQLTQLIKNNWDNTAETAELFSSQKSQTILNNILQSSGIEKNQIQPTLRFWQSTKIAALIVITLCAGLLIVKYSSHKIQQVSKVQLTHNALPGNNKAILTLSNGDKVTLDNQGKGIIARQGNVVIVKRNNGCVDYKTNGVEEGNTILFNTISTPKGAQYQVVLPDGSKVWLNAASSIKFPTKFIGRERHVEITGEGYFEVTKNTAMPFVVNTGREEVKVLGTHFCIMAYDGDGFVKTSLLEGAISLTIAKHSHILKPGNQAVLDFKNDLKIIEDGDVEQAVAWKDGFFQFKDADIKDIMRQAERWYDVNVIYQGQIPSKQFTGKITRNVNLSELLNMFKYAGINFSINGNNITVIN